MKAMIVDLTKLPAKIVDDAMRVSGSRSPRALVLKGLKLLAEREAEPVTPQQSRANRKAAKSTGVKLTVDPRLKKLGVTEADLWGLN